MRDKFSKSLVMPIILGLLPNILHAYTPPIGIPDPVWSDTLHPIDTQAPNRPSAWPDSESPNHYYIDNSDPRATDTDNPNGTPNKPRKTLLNTTYSADTYIEIHGGPYETDMRPRFDCTVEAPCWLRGESTENRPIMQNTLYLSDATYLIIENLNFESGTGVGVYAYGDNTHHIAFRNSRVADRPFTSSSTAVSMLPNTGGKMHDIVIYNNEFSRLGDWKEEVDQDYHGVTPNLWGRDSTTELSDIWILNNSCAYLSGNCVQINAGNWTDSYKYLHHVYIGFNEAHKGRQSGFWSKQGSDIIMSQNRSYENRSHGKQPGDGIGFQYAPHNLWIIFNELYDCNYGIRQSDTGSNGPLSNDVYVIGNLIYNIRADTTVEAFEPTNPWGAGRAIDFWNGNMNRYVIDNTIHNVDAGIAAIYEGHIEISGNIISDIHPNGRFLEIEHPARSSLATVGRNLFYDADSTRFRWNFASFDSMESWAASSDQCSNCIFADPALINPNSKNYKLSSTSPAIDQQKAHFVYERFETLYGLSINKDYTGETRPRLGQDLGAFELGTFSAPPQPPSALEIILEP